MAHGGALSSRKRVVFTTPVLEHPPRGGPELRIENSIKALSRIAEVHVISRLSRAAIGGSKAEAFYSGLCASFAYAPSVGGLRQNRYLRRLRRLLLRSRTASRDSSYIVRRAEVVGADVIWFGYGNISFDVIEPVKLAAPHIPVVCDTDSVWSRFVLRELPLVEDPQRREEIRHTGEQKQAEERAWVELCEVTTAVSEVDAEYYRSITSNDRKVQLFPNVIDLQSYADDVSPQKEIRSPSIFLAGTYGAATSPMNRAAAWFMDDVLPLVIKVLPEARLYLIGRGSDQVLPASPRSDVVALGEVDSVVPYLKHSDVSIVPLSYESGTRFKILEAGACGVPVISTTLGAEGLPVTHDKDILLADTPEAFAEAVIDVCRDRELATRLAANLSDLVGHHFSIEALSENAVKVLDATQDHPAVG